MTKFFYCFFVAVFCLNASAQRNVILIIADDLGTDYLGFYEGSLDTANMPRLRQLANEGLRFKQAVANPVCSPTRAGLLTGRFSFRNGIGNFIGANNGEPELDTAEILIPRVLNLINPNSVKSAVFGKWHLHRPTSPSNLLIPKYMGFNTCVGSFEGSLNNFYNWTKYTDSVQSTCTTYATTQTVHDALNWVKQQADSSFFICMSFNAPHTPYHNPPANLHTVPGCIGTKTDINTYPHKYFKAALEAMDTEIGRLLDSLSLWNKLDSTYIIFTSDNGNFKKVAQNVNVNRAKSTIYQAGIHVPLIIKGPGVVQMPRTSNALVNLQDLFATIIEMFGFNNWQPYLPQNTIIDSHSLLPILQNNADSVRSYAFSEIFRLNPDSMNGKTIRNKKYKLLRFDDGRKELYNLETDSNELNDLLLSNLDSDAQQNFDWLCNQFSQLTGLCGSVCAEPLQVTVMAQPVYCFGNTTGIVSAQVNGGNLPYAYNWSNGCTTSTNSSVVANTYTVTVTDFCGLTKTASATVVQPDELYITNTITNNTCGVNDGVITLQVSNGISPYSFLWNDGNTLQTITDLLDNNYTVTVTDAIGCTKTETIILGCIPPKPLHITGPYEICPHQQNVVYSTQPVTGATVYTWSKPGKAEIISGQGTTSIVVNYGNQGGHVQVKAGNSNGYSLNKKQLIQLGSNCRLADSRFDAIKIFPQPCYKQLSVSGANQVSMIHLTNQLGQIVTSVFNNNKQSDIFMDTAELTNGIYYLKVFSGDALKVYKVIKN